MTTLADYIPQTEFPPGPPWLSPNPPDPTGYHVPSWFRELPALRPDVLAHLPPEVPIIEVIGTVRDEALPLHRSLQGWALQKLPIWALGRVVLNVLDDGSSDDPEAVCTRWLLPLRAVGIHLRYSRWRTAEDREDRSCTLLFNAAIHHLLSPAPLLMFQWWDRIPGSPWHLSRLLSPHRTIPGIVTSAVTRHIGGSSSMEIMTPDALASILRTVPWERDLLLLARIAGRIGGHCVPGSATESSGFVIPLREFLALGGYDERYTRRAGYANVELWRRILQGGLRALFVPEPVGANYHQSHPANREKDHGFLHDPRIARNQETGWGHLTPIDAEPHPTGGNRYSLADAAEWTRMRLHSHGAGGNEIG
jgi:hypothetical protein